MAVAMVLMTKHVKKLVLLELFESWSDAVFGAGTAHLDIPTLFLTSSGSSTE
jgi:hypothetical protein